MINNMLSTTEAAAIAHRHQRTIIAWIHAKKLAAMKMPGGRGPYLIKRKDLEELLVKLYTPQPYEPQEKNNEPGTK